MKTGSFDYELKRAEPMLRASSSSVLRSEVRLTSNPEGPGAERRAAPPATGLPCPNTINCNETKDEKLNRLSAGHRKTAFALRENCRLLIERHGLNRMGFLTLTFARHIVDYKQAQKALHSLLTGVLRHRYAEYIIVMERMASGRVHYHLLTTMKEDIRTGFDFDAIKRGDYHSANEHLRGEWAFWRRTAPKYGFGRTELKPVRKCGESISWYVGKYIEKHIGNRKAEDKGARLVRYSKGTNRVSTRFTWCSPGADLGRTKLGTLCRQFGLTSDNYAEHFRLWYGSNWIMTLGPLVKFIKPAAYPTLWALQKDYPDPPPPPEEWWDDPRHNPSTGR
jgi:hypothetical protein